MRGRWLVKDKDIDPHVVLISSDVVDGYVLENAHRTTATVKLRGSIDVLLTPLLLESFQRYSSTYCLLSNWLQSCAICSSEEGTCIMLVKRSRSRQSLTRFSMKTGYFMSMCGCRTFIRPKVTWYFNIDQLAYVVHFEASKPKIIKTYLYTRQCSHLVPPPPGCVRRWPRPWASSTLLPSSTASTSDASTDSRARTGSRKGRPVWMRTPRIVSWLGRSDSSVKAGHRTWRLPATRPLSPCLRFVRWNCALFLVLYRIRINIYLLSVICTTIEHKLCIAFSRQNVL